MPKPPAQHNAAVNIARRGPPSSTQRPKSAAENPSTKIATEKIQPSSGMFQSPGPDCVTPTSFVIGRLNTLKAYACPMQRCTHRAAGGTIQRLKPGPAMVRLPSKKLITPLPAALCFDCCAVSFVVFISAFLVLPTAPARDFRLQREPLDPVRRRLLSDAR